MGKPAAASDYHALSTGCVGKDLVAEPGLDQARACQMGVTATPAAGGNRPAFLDLTSCDPNWFNLGSPAGGGSQVPLPPPAVPPGQELICGQNAQSDGPSYARHLPISLTATGIPTATPPPGNPFAPTLAANPSVAPAGRTTQVSGTGFPNNTTVTLALVPVGTPPTTNLAALPGTISLTTNGIGGFSNQLLMIMPHIPPGHYEIRAATPDATATLAFLLAPGTQQPPKFVNRH